MNYRIFKIGDTDRELGFRVYCCWWRARKRDPWRST